MPNLQAPPEKKRRETLLSAELSKYLDKRIRVKFQGGREGMWPRGFHYIYGYLPQLVVF